MTGRQIRFDARSRHGAADRCGRVAEQVDEAGIGKGVGEFPAQTEQPVVRLEPDVVAGVAEDANQSRPRNLTLVVLKPHVQQVRLAFVKRL